MKQDEILEGNFSCKVNLENTVCRNFVVQFKSERFLFHRKNLILGLIFNLMVNFQVYKVKINIL